MVDCGTHVSQTPPSERGLLFTRDSNSSACRAGILPFSENTGHVVNVGKEAGNKLTFLRPWG